MSKAHILTKSAEIRVLSCKIDSGSRSLSGNCIMRGYQFRDDLLDIWLERCLMDICATKLLLQIENHKDSALNSSGLF